MVKTKAERLAQQRLCKRRKYAEIKNDPELWALEKEKQRAKYQKRKSEKKQTSITEKSPREKRQIRKKWKQNSKKYRQSKKEEKTKVLNIIHVPVPESFPEETNNHVVDPIGLFTKEDLQKAQRKIRYKELKKRIKLTSIIKSLQKINVKQKMTIKRLKSLINNSNIRSCQELNEDAKTLQNRRNKRINRVSDISSLKSRKDKKFRLLRQKVIESIETFYNDDAVSTISAGKKEFITKNKRRMQKRYLAAPLKVLHKKMLAETDVKVSYSFFTKHRPFWVLQPKPTNRETCLCIQHTNMELLIKSLYNASIIGEKNSNEIVSHLCCDPNNTKCLLRQCNFCKDKVISYKEFSNSTNLTFFQWRKTSKETVTKKALKKKQVLTVKAQVTTQPLTAIRKLKRLMCPFLLHVHNIVAQYTTMKHLKANLNVSEAVIHVDFSENYCLKYAEEVQSFHFGGSRQQVSLHTSVIYTHIFSVGAIHSTSICTISRCVRHDAAAIWAHLIPLIKHALEINPFITTLHFLSDSPISQYRNKFMFYIITQIKNDFEYISRITWNYTEAGHGKGAPDGVGAVLKRTADRLVNFGRDVGDFESFCEIIKDNVESVVIKIVNEETIKQKENLLPKNLKPFRGTLSIHQVLWDILSERLTLRTVSCFLCDIDEQCIHGKHLGFYEFNVAMGSNDNEFENENIVTLLAETAPRRRERNFNKSIKILSDITLKNNEWYNLDQPSTSKTSQFYK
uniref:Uncharacterized protein n=1 Tax=Bombyx mori TaxID=7091 RepID=A0A8R2R2U5_BOMMO|nr:uncharacterized protein LOC119630403 [Bombyx mori]